VSRFTPLTFRIALLGSTYKQFGSKVDSGCRSLNRHAIGKLGVYRTGYHLTGANFATARDL
jgi:hypothetical protein